jgi:peptidoglycan/xylan/chitin deacetylase (PgdA/CDA1 family)
MSFRSFHADLRRCEHRIAREALQPSRLFRPPYGRVTFKTLLLPRAAGLDCLYWSAGGEDWACGSATDVPSYAAHLLANIKAGDILLLHDDNPLAPMILDLILPRLVEAGFDLATAAHYLPGRS